MKKTVNLVTQIWLKTVTNIERRKRAVNALINFLVCFGFVTLFLGLVLGGGGDSGGSFFSSITIFSADRFLDNFLLLPSPSVLSSPHRHWVT